MTKFEKHQLAEEIRTMAIGIGPAQLSKNPTLAQRTAFVKAYDNAGSQERQDRMHEDHFDTNGKRRVK